MQAMVSRKLNGHLPKRDWREFAQAQVGEQRMKTPCGKCWTLLLLLLVSAAHAQDALQPMTVDDGLRMNRIENVTMSPDGDSVLYTISSLNWQENDYDNQHFLYRVADQSTRQFIGDAGGEDFRFSPDGSLLAFLRDSSSGESAREDESPDAPQIFVMPTTGGEATRLTEHGGGVTGFRWMPGSDAIVFLADEMQSEEIEAERRLGDDSYYVDLAPNGKHASRYSNFWMIDLNERQERRLGDEEMVIGNFDVSPLGDTIVFDARPDTRTNHPGEAELYLYSIGERSLNRLTDNAAPESSAIWSPDGRYIAYRAPDDGTHELRNGYFWILDTRDGSTRRLGGQSTGELTGGSVWSADGRYLLYNEIHGTNTNLYRIDVGTGEAQALTEITGTLRAQDFSADTSRMVYSYENFTTPPDLFVSDLNGRGAQQITDANPWVSESLLLSDGELLSWTSKGDMTIEGVFIPAIGADSGSMPLIVEIHGGPAGVIENAFRHDFQMLAGQGFAVLAPNFRGSTGYGDVVLRGLMGEVGDGEFVDIMTGVDHVIAERNIDPERLGVRGWSWGGVSSSYVITQTDRFKAASIGAMVTNWAAETGPGFNFDVSLWYIGGMPWSRPEEWRRRSSITFVENVTTPSIIFHGAADETSSVGQSLMFYTALREIGRVPVRYMRFPREGHGIREPRHVRKLEHEELAWFKRYIEQEEWSAPPPSFGTAP